MTTKELTIEPKMTIKEVAEVLGVSERTIARHAREMGLTENGKTTYLNETQVTKIKLRIEKSGRNDLDNVGKLPKTDLEKELIIQQAAMFQAEKIESLKQINGMLIGENKALIKEIEIHLPKSQFYDQVTGSKDAIDIGSAAKILNIKGLGRNNLFEILRDMGVLQPNNQPYQAYIDRGYFRTIEQSYTKQNGSTHINIKTVVFQKGLDFIRKKICFNGSEEWIQEDWFD